MNKMMAVAAREIMSRKLVLITAPVWGVLVAVTGVLHHARADGITAAIICALIFGTVVALVIGSSTVGRELGERRLSFHFARPISAVGIWSGKFLGALAIIVASQILVITPTLIASRGFESFAEGGIVLAAATALAVAFLALGIVLGIVLRARDGWVAVDLGVLIGSGLLTGLAWRIFESGIRADAPNPFLARIAVNAASIVALVLLIASAVAVIGGRSDLRRAHRATSLVLLALIPVALGGVLWARWFISPTGHDMRGRFAAASPDGRWGLVIGRAAGRGPIQFERFIDLRTHRAVDPRAFAIDPAFSRNGRLVAWIAGHDLMTLALDRAGAEPIRSRSLAFASNAELALSPAGDRILIAEPRTISVYSLPDERPLAVIPSEHMHVQAARFLGPTRLRLYRASTPERIRIDEVDLATGKLQKTGELELVAFRRVSPDGDRIVGTGVLSDGRSGARVAALPVSTHEAFLNDGRVVLISADGVLRLLSRDGKEERSIALGVAPWAIANQPSDREVVITSNAGARIVDLVAGSVREIAANAADDLVEYDGSVQR